MRSFIYRTSRVHRHASQRTPRLRCSVVCILLLSMLLLSLAVSHVTAQDGESHDVPMFRGNPARAASSGEITLAIAAPTQARTLRRSTVRASPQPDAVAAVVLDKGTIIDLAREPKIVDATVWYPVIGDAFTGWLLASNLDLTTH